MRCNPTSATIKNENEYCLMRSWLKALRGLGWALKNKLLCGRSCWARPLKPISKFWNTNSKNRFLSIYCRKIDENFRKWTTNASTLNSFSWQQCLKEIINYTIKCSLAMPLKSLKHVSMIHSLGDHPETNFKIRVRGNRFGKHVSIWFENFS